MFKQAAFSVSQPFGVDATRATCGQRRHIQYYKPRFTRDRNRPLRSVLFMPGYVSDALFVRIHTSHLRYTLCTLQRDDRW